MPLYRKKAIVIKAFQYWGSIMDAPEWALNAFYRDVIFHSNGKLFIRTLEGNMEVSEQDYIIEGIQGELYPCKPDIFEATYDLEEE